MRPNRRFERRFHHIEALCRRQGKSPDEYTVEELEVFWQLAKQEEV